MNDITIPGGVRRILDKLTGAGYDAYVVGGCVRDALRGKAPHDWDICTSATPAETKAVFDGEKVIETGIKHGTLTVLIEEEAYEVTTYRIDGNYKDHRHPSKVTFTDRLEEDLARRDFTINAMAYHPDKELIDPFGGQEDLRFYVLRCVGDPDKRFQEDALRMMRAIRFSAQQGYSIEQETEKSIYRNLPLLDAISKERLRDELCKLLIGSYVKRVLLKHRDIIARIIPELCATFGFQQHNPHHIYDVWTHTVNAVDEAKEDLIVRLTMLLHDIGKPACFSKDENGIGHFYGHGAMSAEYAKTILTRLRFDNQTIDTVVNLIECHDAPLTASQRTVRRMLNKLGPDTFAKLLDVHYADVAAQATEYISQRHDEIANIRVIASRELAAKNCISLRDLAVSGKDLLAAGYCPGPGIGRILNEMLQAVIDDPSMNNREVLMQALLENHFEANQTS